MGLSRLVAGCVTLAGAVGCAGHAAGLPAGPAPEYERPRLAPWDAGAPTKPQQTPSGDAGLRVPKPAGRLDPRGGGFS
jgi:hypothetical protein